MKKTAEGIRKTENEKRQFDERKELEEKWRKMKEKQVEISMAAMDI